MTIKARIELDSITYAGARLTTFVLTYPRFIHAEFMTHRMISRNASSSRAIPVKKLLQAVQDEPAIPVKWVKNQPGMQGYELIDQPEEAQKIWLEARDKCVEAAQKLSDLGVHKQLANRLIEPWSHITVIASATNWENFFGLRLHPMAEDNFQALVQEMKDALMASTPTEISDGDWHTPFVTAEERKNYNNEDLVRFSVARCARVSYLNHDGTVPDPQKDFELHDKLVIQQPAHASPAEHQAMAISNRYRVEGNFKGWTQYRKTLKNECITVFPWENDNAIVQ